MFLAVLLPLEALMIFSFAFVPYVTRRTELFGVSVPSDQIDAPELMRLKRIYLGVMMLLGVLLMGLTCVFGVDANWEDPQVIWFVVPLLLGYVVAAFVVYLPCHFAMKRLKAGKDWDDPSRPAVITVSTAAPAADTISPAWLLLFPLVIVIWLVAIWVVWPQVPDPVPTHYGLDGLPDTFVPKGVMAVLPMALVQVVLAGILAGVFCIIRRARRQTDAAKPEQSLAQDMRFRRWNSIFMVVLGVVTLAFTSTTQIITMLGVVSNGFIFLPTVILVVFIGIAVWVMMFRIGQGGSRIRTRAAQATGAVNYDDDRFWKLGTFYFNPEDPAVFVEKRFGVGWTNNFARPLTWVLVVGLLVLVAGLIVTTVLMTR
ncbi:MAG: DUF5808 domain-containing protein [Propionibacteriaceae bacterium]|jgi:uncharacterized membrane protein|nr:DUF5808 domain-containing protein [Propionibacteriaceae bacterium]